MSRQRTKKRPIEHKLTKRAEGFQLGVDIQLYLAWLLPSS